MEEENKDISKAYSEVIEVLKIMDEDEKLDKLPMEFVELLKKKSDSNYKPEIKKDIPIEEQNLMEEAYSILAWISKKYWHENILDKEYVANDIDIDILQYLEENKNLPVLYTEVNWFSKIKIKLIKFINKVFKK